MNPQRCAGVSCHQGREACKDKRCQAVEMEDSFEEVITDVIGWAVFVCIATPAVFYLVSWLLA